MERVRKLSRDRAKDWFPAAVDAGVGSKREAGFDAGKKRISRVQNLMV